MRNFRLPIIEVLAGLCVAVLIVGNQVHFWSRAYAFIKPQPENFTELYFDDHLSLPKTASPGAILSFNFTIHNLEHATVDYPVEITVEDDSNPPVISHTATTDLTLANDDLKTTLAEARIPVGILTPRAKVSVILPEQKQSIHFWVHLPLVERAIGAAEYAQKLATMSATPKLSAKTASPSAIILPN